MKPGATSGGVIAFEVDDLATLITRLKKENVHVVKDIFQSPVCQMAIVLDSEGNLLMLHQLNRKD